MHWLCSYQLSQKKQHYISISPQCLIFHTDAWSPQGHKPLPSTCRWPISAFSYHRAIKLRPTGWSRHHDVDNCERLCTEPYSVIVRQWYSQSYHKTLSSGFLQFLSSIYHNLHASFARSATVMCTAKFISECAACMRLSLVASANTV